MRRVFKLKRRPLGPKKGPLQGNHIDLYIIYMYMYILIIGRGEV